MTKLSRIESEKQTARLMIELYCRHKEGNRKLCPSCLELLEYAQSRLSRCPFGEKKTTCRTCTVHCYRKDMRKKMQQVMRYAGPRMLFHHPLAAMVHIWRELGQQKMRTFSPAPPDFSGKFTHLA